MIDCTYKQENLTMKQINWQDSFQGETLKENFGADRKIRNTSQSEFYADQFTTVQKKRINEFQAAQKHPSTFRDRYIIKKQNKNPRPLLNDEINEQTHDSPNPTKKSAPAGAANKLNSNGNESTTSSGNDKAPVFEFNQKSQRDKKTSESWNFLNLKNKKQTGDLYKKIMFFNKKNDSKVFNFMGSRGKEGVTTIFANLIDYLNSQTTGKKILVIDANSKSPSLHKVFNISPSAPGLLDIFNNRIEIRDTILPITSNIFLLCYGRGNADNSGIERDSFVKLIKYCKSFFDYVFIDCAPVLSSTDSLNVAYAADYSFLIIQSANDQRPVIEKSKSMLLNDECKIGGVILNRVQQVIPGWLYKHI